MVIPIGYREIKTYLIFVWCGFLQAAEAGNLEDFMRLFHADNSRISIKDGKGRTAAHQAAARNRVNILQFICAQQGGKYKL